ncbi:MAG: CDP-alcohol phosphatidyltransferase family protein [Lachnospiraceae bacterium]|nr:CDP-alcohol phosphatidyltransferase family protein [Lachnospiraceae bacterium]
MIGFYNYTVILTYIGLASSIIGMTAAMQQRYKTAIVCLMISGLCDMFDGKVARTKKDRTEDEKKFGIQIDSLCDVVCFGVFPAIIGYSLGIKRGLGLISMILYVTAAVIRLGYFNVSEEKRQQETDENRKYYQGLPVTSAAIIFPLVFTLKGVAYKTFAMKFEIALIITAILFITDFKMKKLTTKQMLIFLPVVLFILARIILMGLGIDFYWLGV